MGVAVYLPILGSLLLGASSHWLARALPPRMATLALVLSAVLVAGATSLVLGVLAFTLLGTLPVLAALGSWSVSALTASNPVPHLVAVAACVAVLLLGVSGVRAALRRVKALAAARALCLSLGGGPGQLVVLEDDSDGQAGSVHGVFALPGANGRIIASRALLASLSADERRALLAHESAHLRDRHHLYRATADLAAAVNPLLRPLATAVRFSTERWADEVAATRTGDRAAVARALALTGLRQHAHSPSWHAVALGSADSAVVARVRALLAPPMPARAIGPVLAQAVLAAVLALTVASAVEAQSDAEQMFEQARPSASASSTVPDAATPDAAAQLSAVRTARHW